MKIRPCENYIVILPDDKIKTSKSGFIVPDSEQEMTYMAKVVAVGEGRTNEDGKTVPMKIKVGQTVLHKSYGVMEVYVGTVKHYILEERNILAVMEDK